MAIDITFSTPALLLPSFGQGESQLRIKVADSTGYGWSEEAAAVCAALSKIHQIPFLDSCGVAAGGDYFRVVCLRDPEESFWIRDYIYFAHSGQYAPRFNHYVEIGKRY